MIENHRWFGPERKVRVIKCSEIIPGAMSVVFSGHVSACAEAAFYQQWASRPTSVIGTHGDGLRSATVGVFMVVIGKHFTSELLNPLLSWSLNFQQHAAAGSQTFKQAFLARLPAGLLALSCPAPPGWAGLGSSWHGGAQIRSECLSSLAALVPEEEPMNIY